MSRVRSQKGFTLIELLVVIVIIGILATLAVVVLNSTRARARDVSRISTVKALQTALTLYEDSEGVYPEKISFGSSLIGPSGKTYMTKIPNYPVPIDGDCDQATTNFVYERSPDGVSYTIKYCLGGPVSNIPAGNCEANPDQICFTGGSSGGGSVSGAPCTSETETTACPLCQKCENNICVNQSVGEDKNNHCPEINCSNTFQGYDGNTCFKYTKATAQNGVCNGAGNCFNYTAACSDAVAHQTCGSAGCKIVSACVAGLSTVNAPPICYEDNLQHNCNVGLKCVAGGSCAPCVNHTDCGFCEECVNNSCVNQSNTKDIKEECNNTGCYSGYCSGSGTCGIFSDGVQGNCPTNQKCLAGVCVTCAASTDCGFCQKCSATTHTCVNQTTIEDIKNECAVADCASGNCNGLGACAIYTDNLQHNCPSGQKCVNGACAACSVDNDCGFCQKCSNGACVNQSDGEDKRTIDPINGDCNPVACAGIIKGFNLNVCEKYSASTAKNGACNGNGACNAYTASCSGAATHITCPSVGCNNTCPVGALTTSYPNLNNVCYDDNQQHNCPIGLKCVAGDCFNACIDANCGPCQKCAANGFCINQLPGEDIKNDCAAFNCPNLLKGFNLNVCEKYTTATSVNGTCNGGGSCNSYGVSCSGVAAHQTCPSLGCANTCPAGALTTNYPNLNNICYDDNQPHNCPGGQKCVGGQCVACSSNADCGLCQKCQSGACVNQTSSEDFKNECSTSNCNTGNCSGAGICGTYNDNLQHNCAIGQKCINGNCLACSTDIDCGFCQKCSNNTCVNQISSEDSKNECGTANCGTGNCSGIGICGLYTDNLQHNCPSGQKCSASGACVVCTADSDCSFCQKCSNGACVNQTNGEDTKNDCAAFTCSSILKGFNINVCEKYTTATSANGACNGAGACNAYTTSCTGASAHQTCGSAGCKNTCPAGALTTSYPNLSNVCYTDGLQHGCPIGQPCSSSGECICVYDIISPTGLTLTADSNQITATWNAVPGATSYKLYGNTNGSNNVLYSGSNLTYINTGLTNSTTYYYSVAAVVCNTTSAKSSQMSAVANPNFSRACTESISLGSSCGGGWLICKPGDGNCGDSPGSYVVVAPSDHLSLTQWSASICSSYSNAGYSGWSLPKISPSSPTTNYCISNFNRELCQMMKRSNICGSMLSTVCCGGGCLSPAPITGINTASFYWSLTERNSTEVYIIQSNSSGAYSYTSKADQLRVRCVGRF